MFGNQGVTAPVSPFFSFDAGVSMKIRVVGPDAVFAILCILLAAAVLWDLRTVPPPVFDPIGSAAVPRALAWLMIAFSLWVLISGLIRKAKPAEGKGGRAQWAAMICVAAITLVYAVFITFAWLDFGIVSALYLFATITFLERPPYRQIPFILLLSTGIGFGCDHVFTQFFFIDLP